MRSRADSHRPWLRLAAPLVLAVSLIATACRGSTDPDAGSAQATAGSVSPSTPASPSDGPRNLPSGLPAGVDRDVPADALDPGEIVPPVAEPGPLRAARTDEGETAVITWSEASQDPLRAERGLAIWRRTPGTEPPWRPVAGQTIPADDLVLGVDVRIADVTGDGSDDALVTEITGGNGTCGIWTVIDLTSGKERYHRTGCDQRVDPAPGRAGLLITEAIYAPDDPHCCPSSTRRTTLVNKGGTRWKVVSRTSLSV